jgi:hypothetical protein
MFVITEFVITEFNCNLNGPMDNNLDKGSFKKYVTLGGGGCQKSTKIVSRII